MGIILTRPESTVFIHLEGAIVTLSLSGDPKPVNKVPYFTGQFSHRWFKWQLLLVGRVCGVNCDVYPFNAPLLGLSIVLLLCHSELSSRNCCLLYMVYAQNWSYAM